MIDEVLLDYAGLAAKTGLALSTLRRYRSIGLLPEPDAMPAPDRPRWRESTIAQWMSQRPGRGAPGRKRRPKQPPRNPKT